MTIPLGKSITRDQRKGTEQPVQILLPTTEIGGYVSITNTLRTGTAIHTHPNIQPTIFHTKKMTRTGKSDRKYFPIGNLNSGIDVPRSGRNIDNRTGINPQGPIMTTITESDGANNCDIFKSVSRTSDIVYMVSSWNVIMKSDIENLVETSKTNQKFWARK